MRKCSKCKEIKDFSLFYKNKCKKDGFSNYCKKCSNESTNKWVKENENSYKNRKNIYSINRRRKDINFRLEHNLRKRISNAVKRGYKSGSAVNDLGCTIEFFKQYLESKFQPGMKWENYGEWHIDHITPLSNFDLTNRDQLLKACHYTNLQPLWAIDNIKKSDKMQSLS